ncbi:P-loop NTPase [Arthrobacter sp. HMWF013]|uniref:P-loop NTPase n=1 Tax=Arthrobacter sp. HMWF013 TaxID=2056849 RepID=UPI000D3A0AC5|nr:P-loop NTPase [Arthrobacter sp. HMWF013]PTT66208.1 sodium:proton antiporter [Arthrobacter sp. HMWF013]
MTQDQDGGAAVTQIETAVRAAAGGVIDPELRRPLADLGMIDAVAVHDGVASVVVLLTIVGCPAADRIEHEVRTAVLEVPGIQDVRVVLGVMTDGQRADMVTKLRNGKPRATTAFTADSLTRVIAVTSGKGGVGKSTVTANLAVALAARGLRVGLLDADVYGFSIPGLVGLVAADGRIARPTRVGELVLPPVAHGVKVVSIGMFLPEGSEGTAISWRGPMLHKTLEQFITDVFFGDLDVLLVDMPPGTGDIAISVGHLLPHAEVLVVTTPQPAAAGVAVRSGQLARQLGQRIIGVIETMSPVELADGSTFEPFGAGGADAVAAALSTPEETVTRIASIPFSTVLRADGDDGLPITTEHHDDPAARAFRMLADLVATRPRGLAGRKLPLSVG